MKALLLGLLFLTGAVYGATESLETTAPEMPVWRIFEVGGMLQGSMPGKFSTTTSDQDNGIGAGYGFTFGVRPIPQLTVQAVIDGIFHNADAPSTTNSEFASNASIGIQARVFPLGQDGPRFYALLGIAHTQHWIHESFKIMPEDGKGISYAGLRYSVGVGYEQPVTERFSLFAELDLNHTRLTRRTIKDRDPIPLTEPAVRTMPTLRVGMVANF